MKKNIFKNSKSSKGFYTALGISALMIGSACYFSYSESTKQDAVISESSQSEEAVDRKQTDVPKVTTAMPVTTMRITTTRPVKSTTTKTTAHTEVVTRAITEAVEPQNEPAPTPSATTIPLADISNVINPFSGKELVKNQTTGSWQTHNGVDIAAAVGDNVYAVGDGEITAVNDDPLWGTTVIIDHHNGFISRYCGLAKDLPIQQGNSVKSGDVIGAIGDTADIESSLDPHLHIELIQNGEYVNPIDYFG